MKELLENLALCQALRDACNAIAVHRDGTAVDPKEQPLLDAFARARQIAIASAVAWLDT